MLNTNIPLIPVAVFAALVLAILVAWLVRRHKNAYRRLDRVLKRIGAGELCDIVIPDAVDGHIHIDRLVLTEQGALVVEFKNVAGTVFAGERLEEWAILTDRGRQPLRNPLPGLQDRITAVRALAPELPVDGCIVFNDGSEFPKGRPEKVCLLRELAERPKTSAESYSAAWAEIRQQIESAQSISSPLPQGEG
ncbi:MAG TPA: nuclease-related domain-containing protein [Gammaproteobacteria bacterium]|nr:nuclease-related domain-containing protein [Gammaproteobacteria bacterium]